MSFQLNYNLLLGSKSPRRKELLTDLGLKFSVVNIDAEEDYPDDMDRESVAEYLAVKKANAYSGLQKNECLITADTIVLMDDKIFGKPADHEEAKEMLSQLSGKTHLVISGVSIYKTDAIRSFSGITEVEFRELEKSEIDFYVDQYSPLDKAGAYGIQEWIGLTGVRKIRGSYFNVMGLAVNRLWEELKKMDVVVTA
jgi:septum formation protein